MGTRGGIEIHILRVKTHKVFFFYKPCSFLKSMYVSNYAFPMPLIERGMLYQDTFLAPIMSECLLLLLC